MEYYLPNNDNNSNNCSNNNNNNNNNNNDNKTMMMMIIIIRMMTMMIIGTTTIMIIIITTTLTMTIMIMIKTAQTPCQSLYKDRRIQNKIAWYNWYNRDDVMLILYEMLHTCSIMHTQWRCKFENTKHRCLGMFLHKCNLHCSHRRNVASAELPAQPTSSAGKHPLRRQYPTPIPCAYRHNLSIVLGWPLKLPVV